MENNYNLGTFIRTSSFTRPAIETAHRLPIQLISGEMLTRTLVNSEIGVTVHDGTYDLDPTFWQDIGKLDETIPASEVPLSSNVNRIRAVLRAMKHTDGTAAIIQSWVAANTDISLSNRHVYINANSATILGFARKEPATDPTEAQRWGLTPHGAEFITVHPESADAQNLLQQAIRGVPLVERICEHIVDTGELTINEIQQFITDETTGLSESSVTRRGSVVREWLSQLPDITDERNGSGNAKKYVYSGASKSE